MARLVRVIDENDRELFVNPDHVILVIPFEGGLSFIELSNPAKYQPTSFLIVHGSPAEVAERLSADPPAGLRAAIERGEQMTMEVVA